MNRDFRHLFVVVAFTLILIPIGWIVIRYQLPYSILILSLIPILISAKLYSRWVYLFMMTIAVIIAVWVAVSMSIDLQSALITIGITAVCGILIAEILHSMSISQEQVTVARLESASKYRSFIEGLPVSILIMDEGAVVFANRAAAEMAGLESGEQLVGEQRPLGISDKDLSRLKTIREDHIHEESIPAIILEMDLQRINGESFRVKAVISLLSFQGFVATQIVLEDISERVQGQAQLNELMDRSHLISEISSDHVYMASVGPHGAFVVEWGAEALSRLTGYSVQEITELEDILSILHPEDQILVDEYREQLLAGNINRGEFRLITEDEQILRVQNIARPLEDPETGKISRIIAVMRDITDLKRFEDAQNADIQKQERLVDELQSRQREDALLIDLGDMLQNCVTSSEVYSFGGQISKKIFLEGRGAIFELNEDRKLLEEVVSWGDALVGVTIFTPQDCWALRRTQEHIYDPPKYKMSCPHVHHGDMRDIPEADQQWVDHPGGAPRETDLDDTQSNKAITPHLCIPMNAQGEMLGILHLQFSAEENLQRWLRVARALAGRIGLALANLRLRDSIENQAHYDIVTGLYIHSYWVERFQQELNRSIDSENSITFVLMDIDDFTQFNATYGRDVGDRFLRELGSLINNHLRREEFVGRFGGDGFALAFPGATLEETLERTGQLKVAASELRIQHNDHALDGIAITASISGYPWHGRKLEEILHAAEEAGANAKREGGNKIVLAV